MTNSLPTRRDALKAGALGLMAMTGNPLSNSSPTFAEDNADSPGWIDAHSHIWTRDIKRYPLANGKTLKDLDPPSFTTEELLKTAKPEGVTRVVLIAHNGYYRYDNSYMIDAATQYPGTFRIVGMVDETKPHPDVAMKKLLQIGVTGFRITPSIRGRETWLKSDGMATMWKTAAQTNQSMCCLINPKDLADVADMCKKYPETPVVIDHFARIGIDGEIRERDLKALCKLAEFPKVRVKVSAYYALGKKSPPHLELIPMIKRLYETFGPKRLMWASDCPYQIVGKNNYAASIGLIRDRIEFLTDDDKQWMLRKTAETVYFFEL